MMHKLGAVMVNADAGFNHRPLQPLNRRFARAIQEPLVTKCLDLFWQRIARMVFVDGVVVAIGIERRVKIDQVNAFFVHLLLHNRQAVAIVKCIHP